MNDSHMASDETFQSCSFDEDDHQNLSRLSMCTSSSTFDDDNILASMCASQLSIESFDADAELSAPDDDSENEFGTSCYSLPSTPPRRKKSSQSQVKDYASDNNGNNNKSSSHDPIRRRRRIMRKKEEHVAQTGVMLITRPKGGNRSLCMGLEEVKACRDLGFELEHQRMLEIPSRLSFSNSSSGSNSPIANWRISSPGDDPRDVKARLKVWAQAVALASASKYAT